MRNSKGLWLRLLPLTLAALLLGTAVYRFNAEKILGNKMPMPLGFGISVVLSGSMEPALSANDLVVIRQTRDVETGDVIVFQSGNSLVIHRAVEVNGDTIVTRGDANNTDDPPIRREDVKGKLVLAIPGMGGLVQLLQQPLLLIALLAVALLLMEQSYRQEKQSGNEEIMEIEQEIRSLKQALEEKKEREERL